MRHILLTFILIYTISLAQELSIPIKVESGASDHQILYIGIDPKATDGLDTFLEETPLPPVPPKGGFDARFNLPVASYDASIKDYRPGNTNSFSAKITYELQFQPGSAGTIKINWSLPNNLNGVIQDLLGGIVINKKMEGAGELVVTNQSINKLNLIIDYDYHTTKIENEFSNNEIPTRFNLFQNYPNPFNPETKIEYWIPEAGKVTLKIYDVLGREVETLVDQLQEAGKYEMRWNASKYTSGVYFYNIVSGNYRSVKKMMLIK